MKTQSLTFSVIMALLLSSCALFSAREVERLEFFTGEGLDPLTTSEEIKANLRKSASNAGGYYEVFALPLTRPLIQARRQEQAVLRGLNPRQLAELEMQDEQKYLMHKFCAEIDAQITRHHEVKSLKEWSVVVMDAEGVPYEMNWVEPEASLVTSTFMGGHGAEERWHLSSIACADREIEVSPEFSLHITPPFTPWPFPDTMRLRWAFHHNDQERKESSPTYRRYRGY